MLKVNDIPKPGDCGYYVKRSKRFCDNPATWQAEYADREYLGRGYAVAETNHRVACCQLHAKWYHKNKNAKVSRIMPIGSLTVDSKPEMPHCPVCGASTQHAVLKDGVPICPFCDRRSR